MHINISGQNLSIGMSVQEYVQDKLNETVKKYFDHATSANVNFTKQNFEYYCDINLNDGTGRHTVIKSRASSDDIYAAFDSALSKVSKQLRKYKSKLKDRHDRIKLNDIPIGKKYVIDVRQSFREDIEEVDVDNPVIIAEKPTSIMSLSVGEAVMYMDLENLPALMFENVKTGRINVVYYRADGNISWVDSNNNK